MATITVRELNQRTGEVLRRVEEGETLIVTNHGRPVATLGPAPKGRWQRMIAEGKVRLATKPFDPDRPFLITTEPGQKTSTETLREMRDEERY